MNELSGMMVRTPRCGVQTAQRAVATLQQIQRAQILARQLEDSLPGYPGRQASCLSDQ